MDTSFKEKKVFISYCWTSPQHEQWVLNLAEMLVHNGVDVVLDKWDLSEGQDKYHFMEAMIRDTSINKVLIICEDGYKEKADERTGGVGTETQIITPALYGSIDERKFIPIIARKETGKFDEYIPTYLKSRIGIDMSCENSYLDGFEQLLRVIYDKPRYKKPQKGAPPKYLFEESKITSKLYFINENLKKYITDNRRGIIELTIKEFEENFFQELDKFIISNENFKEPHDEQLLNYINQMKELRDFYLNFLEILIVSYEKFNSDIIIEFLENLFKYSEYQGTGNTYHSYITEHFKFLITELFLWINLLLIKHKNYKVMNEILYTKYFVKSKYEHSLKEFSNFRFYLEGIEYNRTKLQRLSRTADKFIERATLNGKNYKEQIIDCDLLLYYISKTKGNLWFPTTYVYKEWHKKIELLSKMIRKKHFEETKVLFNVMTVIEMKKLIEDYLMTSDYGFPNSYNNIIPIFTSSISLNDIATI